MKKRLRTIRILSTPVFGFVAVVCSFFLLYAWYQYINTMDKQYTLTSSNKQNQEFIYNSKEFPNHEMHQIKKQLELVPLQNKKKYIIFYCGEKELCGGWGDRQQGITSVYLMALAMGRHFGIIISKPCDISKYLQPNKVNWTIDPKELQGLKSRHLRLIDNKRYISSLQLADLETFYPEDVLYVSTNLIYFHTLLKNTRYKEQLLGVSQMSYGNFFAKIMNLLFRFSDHLQEQFDKFFKVNIPKPNIHLVCAQIRIGKNPSVPRDIPKHSMSDIQIIWNFLSKYNTSKYKIFVTTDSEQVQAIASNKFASQIVCNPGEIVHVDRLRKGVKDYCDSVRKVLMDQYILTECDTLLVSRSGFGEHALMMSQKENNFFYFKNKNITEINKETLANDKIKTMKMR